MTSLLNDPDLADPHRLGLLCALAESPQMQGGFGELAQRLGMTDGNLASHLRRLERAAVVEIRRNGARGRASRTLVVLSAGGFQRLGAFGRQLDEAARVVERAGRRAEANSNAVSINPGQSVHDPVAASSSPAEKPSIVDDRFADRD